MAALPGLRRCPLLALSTLLMVGLFFDACSVSAALPERRLLRPFDYHGVTLEDGPLKRQFDEVRDYYLHIPNDNLLKGFRQRAGRFAPGTAMGGWYSDDVFHIFGQILSGLARMTAVTGDPACKAKAGTLLAEWARCIEQDGYFYYTRKPNAPHYIYDKMVGGLVDMYLYAGKHTLSITLVGEKTANSQDRYLNVAGFEVLDGKK